MAMAKNLDSIEVLRQRTLLDLKWRKLLKLAKWFRYAPFVDFVLGAGSMAIGNVHPESDFDVIVGVREGRIFSARYGLNLIFSLLRARRLDDFETSSRDKFCFNHFVTPATYSKPPHNEYRKRLYANLVPICGNPEKIKEFFEANEWSEVNADNNLSDLRFGYPKMSRFADFLNRLLGGRAGEILEKKIAEPVARRRLERYLAKKNSGGRVIVSPEELEFHFTLPYEK